MEPLLYEFKKRKTKMKIKHFGDMAPIPSEKVGIVGAEKLAIRPLVTKADGALTFTMVLLELGPGGSTPDHSHQREEEIFVKKGRGRLKVSGKDIPLRPGQAIYLGPNEAHQFVNTSSEVLELLCVTQIQSE
jgi:quercetin dioxygenase-like cupin family protein